MCTSCSCGWSRSRRSGGMIRRSHALDLLGWPLLSSAARRNRVYGLERLVAGDSFWRSVTDSPRALASRRQRPSWVSAEGRRIDVMATARPRSGPRSWEVSRLLLEPRGEDDVPDLLLHASGSIARRGGERVFMRIPAGDPLVDLARQGGFFPCYDEVLFSHRPSAAVKRSEIALRPRRPDDDHDLFRLYHAATPAEVRAAAGMTMEQWAASLENPRGRVTDMVYERDGTVRGWLMEVRRAGVALILTTVHPDEESISTALVDYALSRAEGVTRISWLVPEYHLLLGRVVERCGATETARYTISIRSTAATVRDSEKLPAATSVPR